MPTLPDEIRISRARFVAWIHWYLATHGDKVPSKAALANELGVTRSAITQLLARGSTRAPSFETLVGFRRLTGFSLDVLLYTDPPPLTQRPPRR